MTRTWSHDYRSKAEWSSNLSVEEAFRLTALGREQAFKQSDAACYHPARASVARDQNKKSNFRRLSERSDVGAKRVSPDSVADALFGLHSHCFAI